MHGPTNGMPHKLDPIFFSDLARMEPAEVCHRAQCKYDKERGCYQIEVWGEFYEVCPTLPDIRRAEPNDSSISVELRLAILIYLLQAKGIPLSGKWISEKDLPGGAMFFRGPHSLPVRLIADRFGRDLTGFKSRCEGLGGSSGDLAHAAYAFRILPRIPVKVLLWIADSEFDAEAKLLFDRTISSHVPLDVVFGLAIEICSRISR